MSSVAITAAGRGLGLELVRHYAAGGDRVFAFCRDPASRTELQRVASDSGGRVTLHTMDVASDASVAAWIAEAEAIPESVERPVARLSRRGRR